MRVAVIGGGPSGLVTLKYLTTAHQYFPVDPIEVKLFESASKIGGVYVHHMYEDSEMVSSKYYTTFSDFRPRPEDPDFLQASRYLEYLNDYTDHFKLWPYINLSTRVLAVRRREGGGHIVTYQTADGEEQQWECDAIAVCSGLHETPNIPEVPGIEKVPVVMHSADFKSRKQLGTNKTVVVLGAGETGFDLCYLGITAPTKRVLLCHRNGFWGVPKVNFSPSSSYGLP
jgi:dimethylaniline monooxygenase (N-oxide forming)